METSLLRRSNLLCILELNVVKQVDPVSRRRFNWGGGPCIVSWELVSMVAPDNGFCTSLEDLCPAKSSLWFRSPNLPPVRHPNYGTAANVHVTRIQSFPSSTAIPALYCLLVVRPLEQELDLRRLTLLANVLYTDGTLEQDTAMRQISVKDPDSHSWFVSCNELLHKYSLPNIYTVRAEFGPEPQFKQQVKASVDKYIKESWLSVAEDRKSLCFLNMESRNVGKVHPCWSTVDNTAIDVRRAVVKARILMGTYHLQADRDQFHKTGTTSKCPLCSTASEDRLHFLTACVSLNRVRQPHISETEKRLLQQNTASRVSSVLTDMNLLAQLVIDCTSKVISDRLTMYARGS